MKKLLVLSLLTFILLSGCSNDINEVTNLNQSEATQPEETESEATKQNEEAPPAEENTVATETKGAYLLKLNEVEESLTDLQKLNDEGTTVSMTKAADETYKRWDNTLNEVYNELKQQLPTSEMAKLKEEQLNWITLRDKTAKEESSAYKGGTMESLEYIATQARVTKERCYELVQLYMK